MTSKLLGASSCWTDTSFVCLIVICDSLLIGLDAGLSSRMLFGSGATVPELFALESSAVLLGSWLSDVDSDLELDISVESSVAACVNADMKFLFKWTDS